MDGCSVRSECGVAVGSVTWFAPSLEGAQTHDTRDGETEEPAAASQYESFPVDG